VVLSLLLGELSVLPAALPIAYATTAYTVAATAYLTGLRTNSYLFDPRVLARFSALIIPPLIFLVILSFSYAANSALLLPLTWAACILMVGAAWWFYRRIERRWGRASFLF